MLCIILYKLMGILPYLFSSVPVERSNFLSSMDQLSARIAKGFIIAFLLLTIGSFYNLQAVMAAATAVPASTYSCVSPHCYGETSWTNKGKYTPVNGGGTSILVVHLSCPAPACSYANQDFIDTEIWIKDVAHEAPSCPTYNAGCWVEEGVIALPNSSGSGTTVKYFWADYRPGDSKLNYHDLGVVPSADFGGQVSLYISRTDSSNCSTSPRSGTFGSRAYQ